MQRLLAITDYAFDQKARPLVRQRPSLLPSLRDNWFLKLAMHSLLATSSKGLFAFTLTGDVTPVGLQGTVVSQTTARNGIVLAAVPAIQEVHKMMSYGDSDSSRRQPGLYMFDLAGGDANGKHVYNGNVKSCAIGKGSAAGKQRWYAGTEPADVVISEDMGATWADTDSFKALPARDSWYVTLPDAIFKATPEAYDHREKEELAGQPVKVAAVASTNCMCGPPATCQLRPSACWCCVNNTAAQHHHAHIARPLPAVLSLNISITAGHSQLSPISRTP